MDSTVTEGTYIDEIVQEVEDELNHPINVSKAMPGGQVSGMRESGGQEL